MTTTWATSKNWKNKNCTHGVLKIPISIAKVVSIEISKLVDRRQLGNNKKNKEIDKLFEILNKLVTCKVGIMLRRDANQNLYYAQDISHKIRTRSHWSTMFYNFQCCIMIVCSCYLVGNSITCHKSKLRG